MKQNFVRKVIKTFVEVGSNGKLWNSVLNSWLHWILLINFPQWNILNYCDMLTFRKTYSFGGQLLYRNYHLFNEVKTGIFDVRNFVTASLSVIPGGLVHSQWKWTRQEWGLCNEILANTVLPKKRTLRIYWNRYSYNHNFDTKI